MSDDEQLVAAIRSLLNEVDCRIEHGAETGGHLEYVRVRLIGILELYSRLDLTGLPL